MSTVQVQGQEFKGSIGPVLTLNPKPYPGIRLLRVHGSGR